MTASVTHLWRLLKWGRTLARHGALKGIEADPLTPVQVRRLVGIVSIGDLVKSRIDEVQGEAMAMRNYITSY